MCKWYEIDMTPRDILFFRGGKPMGAASIGEGASWPVPAVFHHAMLSAFHHRWPERQKWESEHHVRDGENTRCSYRFGALKSVGVFPHVSEVSDGGLERGVYVPTPADVQCLNDEQNDLCIMQPQKMPGSSNLPRPLDMAVLKPGKATKNKPGNWMPIAALKNYLKGDVSGVRTVGDDALFCKESRPGIAVSPESGTVEEGKFYVAEYLRLHDGISAKGFVSCEQPRYDGGVVDVFAKLFAESARQSIIFGGQQGVAALDAVRDDSRLPDSDKPSGRFIKWVLLTPAVFRSGWRPGWINAESGKVEAVIKPKRREGESRKAWRKRFAEEKIPGRLVAACIPKNIHYSGWQTYGGEKYGPRSTRLCVAAGAVYYFEVPEGEDTAPLLEFLHGRRLSDLWAEKGFGFGLCGSWSSEDVR